MIIRRHCAKAFFWDPLGDEEGCSAAAVRLEEQGAAFLFRRLGAAIVAHPLAYARQRLAHWNSTERWLVASGLPSAAPSDESEPNDLGLASPSVAHGAAAIQRLAEREAETPLGWPVLWTFLALVSASVAFERREEPAGRLAFALATSAVCLEASFMLISIASDLRYHLWPMTASALALILLVDGSAVRRLPLLVAGGLLAAIIAAGAYARATLPPAPATYREMILAPTG